MDGVLVLVVFFDEEQPMAITVKATVRISRMRFINFFLVNKYFNEKTKGHSTELNAGVMYILFLESVIKISAAIHASFALLILLPRGSSYKNQLHPNNLIGLKD